MKIHAALNTLLEKSSASAANRFPTNPEKMCRHYSKVLVCAGCKKGAAFPPSFPKLRRGKLASAERRTKDNTYRVRDNFFALVINTFVVMRVIKDAPVTQEHSNLRTSNVEIMKTSKNEKKKYNF